MSKMEVKYCGQLRTEVTHLQSGTKIITDAPTDNHGKGEAFSPTDLTCVSLVTCIITTMGIIAERDHIDISGMRASFEKIMIQNPRRIGEIQIHLYWDHCVATVEQKEKLKKIAKSCPVHYSLSAEIKQNVVFHF